MIGNGVRLWTSVAGCLLTVIVAEQRERRKATVKRENKTAPFDLGDFPSADVVTDLDAVDFLGARANNGARAFVIHHDAKQLHIGRLRHDRDRRRLGWRWRRWWSWTAGR